jgi:hypothetical protein
MQNPNRTLLILTSVVVNKMTGCPSAGNYPDGWEKETQKVFDHKNWRNANKINWEDVYKNRVQLSEKYGTKGYWSNNR